MTTLNKTIGRLLIALSVFFSLPLNAQQPGKDCFYLAGTNRQIIFDDIVIPLIRVEGGTFKMGTQKSTEQASNYDVDGIISREGPVHKVTVSTFYIGQTPVTQLLWEKIMGQTRDLGWSEEYGLDDCMPAYNASYNDALKFIDVLNQKMHALDLISPDEDFRLPTEAEFEFAARGGVMSKGYKYAGSNNLDEVGWTAESAKGTNHMVAEKNPNELNLYGMSGGVWQWCVDYFNPYTFDSKTDPVNSEFAPYRCVRGGGWHSPVFGHHDYCVGNRGNKYSNEKTVDVGFRIVLSTN